MDTLVQQLRVKVGSHSGAFRGNQPKIARRSRQSRRRRGDPAVGLTLGRPSPEIA